MRDVVCGEASVSHIERGITMTDALTGLLGRDEIHARLEVLLAREADSRVAVASCDFDGLVLLNDRYGHSAGDAVLLVVSERIRETVRQGDLVARIGGDEFLIVFDSVGGVEEVLAIAEEVLAIASLPLPYPEGEAVTLSIGLSVSAPGEGVENLIYRADYGVYSAKRRGGNQVALGPGRR